MIKRILLCFVFIFYMLPMAILIFPIVVIFGFPLCALYWVISGENKIYDLLDSVAAIVCLINWEWLHFED